MSQRLRIAYYSEKEGQMWQPWPPAYSGGIDDALLEHKRKNRCAGANVIWIEGIEVHALLLEDGRSWDALNGFRVHASDWRKSVSFAPDPPPHWRDSLMPVKPKPAKVIKDPSIFIYDDVTAAPPTSADEFGKFYEGTFDTDVSMCPQCGIAITAIARAAAAKCPNCGYGFLTAPKPGGVIPASRHNIGPPPRRGGCKRCGGWLLSERNKGTRCEHCGQETCR